MERELHRCIRMNESEKQLSEKRVLKNEEPDPRAPLSEHTLQGARPDAIPAESAGGPPRREDLTMTTDEMDRRMLEDATEAGGRELVQDD